MSQLTNLIPKIEGFQPIPNAVMIPFMETQSAALAYGFGLNYEFGKRTIRSMSNETFNSLTSEQIAEMSAQHSTVLLNRFIQAVPQVMPAQHQIFAQYVEIEKAKVIQNVELAKWIVANAPTIIATGGAGTDIKTEITPEADHAHSIDRPHLHSGTKTIIGTVTLAGITTTHWSDGTITTSQVPHDTTTAHHQFDETTTKVTDITSPTITFAHAFSELTTTDQQAFNSYIIERDANLKNVLYWKERADNAVRSFSLGSAATMQQTQRDNVNKYNQTVQTYYAFLATARLSATAPVKADAQKRYTERVYRGLYPAWL